MERLPIEVRERKGDDKGAIARQVRYCNEAFLRAIATAESAVVMRSILTVK
jgi:hypothetical protein